MIHRWLGPGLSLALVCACSSTPPECARPAASPPPAAAVSDPPPSSADDEALSHQIAQHFGPRRWEGRLGGFTPDGTYAALIGETGWRLVALRPSDGERVMLPPEGTPASANDRILLSPDGTWLVHARGRNRSVFFAVDPAAGVLRPFHEMDGGARRLEARQDGSVKLAFFGAGSHFLRVDPVAGRVDEVPEAPPVKKPPAKKDAQSYSTWRRDDGWTVTRRENGWLEIHDRRATEPLHRVFDPQLAVAARGEGAATVVGDGEALAVYQSGELRVWSLIAPQPAIYRIGDDEIRWEAPRPQEAGAQNNVLLQVRADRTEAGLRLRLHASNHGDGPAYAVQGELVVEAGDVSESRPVLFGMVEPGATVARHIEWPIELTRPVRVRLRARDVAERRAGADDVLVLPRWLKTQEAYEAMAQRVVSTGVEVLREIVHRDDFEPKAKAMWPGGYGFTASGNEVRYQDLYRLEPAALEVNRAVTRTSNREDLYAHGEMFLFWFLPHELVHTVTGAGDWAQERTANLLQPELTEAILARIGADVPYTPQTMQWVYDAYARKLTSAVAPEARRRIEAYALGGQGQPFSQSAFKTFLTRTDDYVYWIARTNQLAGAIAPPLAAALGSDSPAVPRGPRSP